ncbi:MAG: RNA polymerase sporulation sigma factor SigE [Clostridia bacterium]|nr:RNA polymerase sporulation sigma factor SigE [Clostridia bacterium]
MQILTNLPHSFKKIIFSILSKQEVHYIGGPSSLPPPLCAEEEEKYILMLESDPKNAKPTLIERNLRLVVYIAKKFENTGINLEDLISIGTIGLIKSINTFNPHKKIKLATYASRCIENEILMYLRKNSNRRVEISIDEPLNVDWDGNELLLSDILGTESDIVCHNIENEVDKQLLTIALEHLSEREKNIMKLRFGVGSGVQKTQKEVADMLGISQSYISRLEKRIIQRMKKDIAKMI